MASRLGERETHEALFNHGSSRLTLSRRVPCVCAVRVGVMSELLLTLSGSVQASSHSRLPIY